MADVTKRVFGFNPASPPQITSLLDISGAAAGQIKFPASQNASSDVNTLDDYEEGAWTPSIAFGGAAVGVTYDSDNAGVYTKIGNRVFVSGRLVLTSKGSSVGTVLIGGLPFTVKNASGAYSASALSIYNVTFANTFMGHANTNDTTISIMEITEAGTRASLADTDFANDSQVTICLSYITA